MADAERWPCTADEYFASPRISRSRLEVFIESPKLFASGDSQEETPALRWGRLVHLRVLEPAEFRQRIYVKPADLNRRSNAGKAELDRIAAEGLLTVSYDEAQRLEAINAAVLAHPLAGRMIKTSEREVAFTWRDEPTGLGCRARLDLVKLRSGGAAIIDLKSTDDPSPREFGRSAGRYGYHRQAAFYSRPIAEIVGAAPVFFFIAVRSTAPHEVAVYEVDQADIAAADKQCDRAMEQLARCIETNTWAAPWESPTAQTLDIPRWALEENL